MNRPLPQNLDAERALLGIILENNDSLFEVSHILRREDFFEPWHAELYILLRDLIETGRNATPATVLHDLSQDRDIGGITVTEYLHSLERDAPHRSMAPSFAKTLRDLGMRRRLIDVASKHLQESYEAPATVSALEIESRYHAAASTLFSTVQEAGMQPLMDVGRQVVEETQTVWQGERRRGLFTGLKALDDLWGPLLPGRLHAIAGASGSGKTALAWQAARNVADTEPVLFMSLEMDGAELATRDLTFLSGIAGPRIESADLNVSEMEELVEAQRRQGASKLLIDSAKGQTVGHIRGKAMRLKRMRGLGLLVIDHWRYIKPATRTSDLFESMHDDLRAINAIADDLAVPVILLAQLKAAYGSEQKVREPNVGDIFNGAVLEQESDALLLVHRPEYMLARRKPTGGEELGKWETQMSRERNKAYLLLNKRRGGQGYGTRTIGFVGETQRFTDDIPKPPDLLDEMLMDPKR